MDEYGSSYAPREIEATVIEHITAVLDEPTALFSVGVLTAPRGYLIKDVLLHGVVPRLKTQNVATAEINGAWHDSAQVQYCRSPDEVPPAPPGTDSPIRFLLLTATDFAAIPRWMTAQVEPDVRTFPVGSLSLIEAHDLVEAQLGRPMEISNLHRLGTLSGWVPAALTGMVRECRDQAGLELVNGFWRLLGDPVELAMVPYIRAQLAAAPLDVAATLMRIALFEPVALGELSAGEAELGAALIRDGELERVSGGTVRFAAPAVGQALRILSPWDEQREAYDRALQKGKMTAPLAIWARKNNLAVPAELVELAAKTALLRHEWHDVLTLLGSDDDAMSAAYTAPTFLIAAQAARFLPNPPLARAHLAIAEKGLGKDDIAVKRQRAELLHYSDGDLAAALNTLDEQCASADAPELLSEQFIHLVHAGHTDKALKLKEQQEQFLSRAPATAQARVAVAEALAHTAAGKPDVGLSQVTLLAAQGIGGDEGELWWSEELRTATLVSALKMDGPGAFPMLRRHLADTANDNYRPDLLRFYLARSLWAFTAGDITKADGLIRLSLETAAFLDPFGVEVALRSLGAQTAALTGRYEDAQTLLRQSEALPLKSAGIISGTIYGSWYATRYLLGTAYTGPQLRAQAEDFIAKGQFGFACDVLYAGVRFGRLRAARILLEIGEHLQGNLHTMRLAHARGLLEGDAVSLLATAQEFVNVGLRLNAAEATAAAAVLPDIPATAKSAAINRVADYVQSAELDGHAALRRVAKMSTQRSEVLTPREREVADLVDAGLTNKEIGERLSLSPRTVEGHITRIYRKTESRVRPRERKPV